MSSARRRRLPASAADRILYRWALGVAVVGALAFLGLAALTLRDTIDGVPVSAIDAAWPFWLGTLATAALAGGLAQVVIRLAQPRPPPSIEAEAVPFIEDQRRGGLAWVLPAVTVLAGELLVRLYHSGAAAGIGALAALLATGGTIVTHYHLRDSRPAARATAGIALAFLTYAVAFFVLAMIYSNKWRSLYSAVAIAAVCLLLLLQLSDGVEIAWLRRLLYAVIGGLLMGQLTWALNYWAATGWVGGAMLIVAFYTLAELTRHAITARLDRRILIEYGAVLVVAFIILALSVSLNR